MNHLVVSVSLFALAMASWVICVTEDGRKHSADHVFKQMSFPNSDFSINPRDNEIYFNAAVDLPVYLHYQNALPLHV
jgi:hypothetical protein